MIATHIVILFVASIAGGFANAVAGGGTFFTFPALVSGGLSNLVANATSATSIFPGHGMSAYAYREELVRSDRPRLITIIIMSIIGAIAGAYLLTVTSEKTFKGMVPYLLLFATVSFAFGPALQKALKSKQAEIAAKPKASGTTLGTKIAYFCTSIYGGYFGAGQGIVLMTILTLTGVEDVQEANAIKNLVAAIASMIAVIILAFKGLVTWDLGLLMIVGAMVGGFIGGKAAKKLNKKSLRAVIILFGSFLSAWYFYKTYFIVVAA